jgi:hypothetical protein
MKKNKKELIGSSPSFKKALNPKVPELSTTSVVIEKEIYEKLKALRMKEGIKMYTVTSLILELVVNKYEKEHGPLMPIPQTTDLKKRLDVF